MNCSQACVKLDEAGIPYTTESFVNRFNGTRIVIKTLKTTRQASKLLDGMRFFNYKPGAYHTEFYN
jgi:hypothetical protein